MPDKPVNAKKKAIILAVIALIVLFVFSIIPGFGIQQQLTSAAGGRASYYAQVPVPSSAPSYRGGYAQDHSTTSTGSWGGTSGWSGGSTQDHSSSSTASWGGAASWSGGQAHASRATIADRNPSGTRGLLHYISDTSATPIPALPDPAARVPSRSLLDLLPDTLNFSHSFNLQLAHDSFDTGFEAVQNWCINQGSRICKIVNLQRNSHSASLSLKLARDRLNLLEAQMEAQGEIAARNTRATDLGGQMADAETRIRQDSAYLTQLQKLQADARGLAAQRELAREISDVQGRIEQAQSQLVAMAGNVLYETIEIGFNRLPQPREETRITQPDLPFNIQVKQVFERGLDDILKSMKQLVLALALMAPWLMLAIVPVLGVVLFSVRLHRKQKQADAEAIHAIAEAMIAEKQTGASPEDRDPSTQH